MCVFELGFRRSLGMGNFSEFFFFESVIGESGFFFLERGVFGLEFLNNLFIDKLARGMDGF